ncbi:MAG: aminoacetone oxidase family FAD-binding enzyme [Raoultibacter sp.]
MKTIAIIGGGAAGLMAAVAASRATSAEPVHITIYEAADRVGKSILATGNGRCNFSNASVDAELYRNAEFVGDALAACSPREVHDTFADLGLIWHEESEGRLYPLSNKATSVLDVLRFALIDGGVSEVCEATVVAVTPVEGLFLVSFADDTTAFADRVIVACGGAIARSLMPVGHVFRNTEPVLGPLQTGTAPIRGLNNIRVRCTATLYDGLQGKAHGVRDLKHSESKASECGEVLFRDYGVSGIAIFNLSRFAQRNDVLSLDLVPAFDEDALATELARRVKRFGTRTAVELCAGIVQTPVARAVCKSADVAPDAALLATQAPDLAHAFKQFILQVEGIGDARQCQVRRGGFDVASFDPATMQSRVCEGLFLAGEALNVDAPCGGYNLHWAWTSGALAGRFAAEL